MKASRVERLATRVAGFPDPGDYGAYSAYTAARYAGGVRGKRVLVVGCNRGEDCRYFADMAAGELHGLDVIEDVGADFPGPTYHRASAEAIDLPPDRFDLVFAVATLEHVPRIEPAFAEMARVCAPGGVVYSVAAPLWSSSYGHHKGELFAGHPWVHLRLDRDGIVALCKREDISSPNEHSIGEHVDYMLDRRFFNRTPARAYIDACASLAGVELIRNELAFDEPGELTPELESELSDAGYPREELLASAHTVVARKRPFAGRADLSRALRTRVRSALLERAPRAPLPRAAAGRPHSMARVLVDRVPAPARRVLGPVLNPALALANRLRRKAARGYLIARYGGERRRGLLESGLERHYHGLFKRQWQWADEPPHFFDHRIGAFAFATGGQHAFSYYRGYFAAELLRRGDVVLDIGCGDGFFARRFFAPRAAAIDSIDIEESAIEHALAHNAAPNLRFLLRDAVNQPFPRERYDLIVWDGALGHFAADTTNRVLSKIRAGLAPAGAFAGSESLGREGHDHLQFFASLDALGELLGAHFPHVELREIEYEIGGGTLRREAFWRCAVEPDRLEEARWTGSPAGPSGPSPRPRD